MSKLATLAVLLLCTTGKTWAQCECQMESQTWGPSSPTFFIISPVDKTNQLCANSCNITLDSAAPDKGIGNLVVVKFDNPSGNSYFNVYNEDDSKVWPEVRSADAKSIYSTQSSSSPTVRVELVVVDSQTNVVATLQRTDSLYQPQTTAAPATAGPSYPPNSAGAISSDILFALDQTLGANNDATAFAQMQGIISGLTQGMVVTGDDSTTAGNSKSRLAFLPLSPYGGFAATSAWAYDSVYDFNAMVNSTQLIKSSSTAVFKSPISGALDAYFKIYDAADHKNLATRDHAERVIVLLTAGVPSDDLDFAKFVNDTNLSDKDVHLVILGYKLNSNDQAYYKSLKNAAFVPLNKGDQDDIDDVLKNYLISGNKLLGCNADSDDAPQNFDVNKLPDGQDGVTVQLPDDYYGPPQSDGKGGVIKDWDTTFQKGRYCNNQKRDFTFTNSATGATDLCFEVYFDLEPTRDYLYFYNGPELLVSLSGRGVHQAIFKAPSGVRVSFASDDNGVYGGVYLIARPTCKQLQTMFLNY